MQTSPVSAEAKRAREAETSKAQEEAREAAAAPVTQETASRNTGHLWFTQPEVGSCSTDCPVAASGDEGAAHEAAAADVLRLR